MLISLKLTIRILSYEVLKLKVHIQSSEALKLKVCTQSSNALQIEQISLFNYIIFNFCKKSIKFFLYIRSSLFARILFFNLFYIFYSCKTRFPNFATIINFYIISRRYNWIIIFFWPITDYFFLYICF